MWHLDVQIEGEDQEEDSCNHKGTAADELKEVDASTGRTRHYSFYADEANERQDLEKWKRQIRLLELRLELSFNNKWHLKQTHDNKNVLNHEGMCKSSHF